ncbi:MAG: thiamine diphosphokinase [Pseudomonadota bacterium]
MTFTETQATPVAPAAPEPRWRFDAPVALFGGGEAAPEALLAATARSVALIAADGGANRFALDKQRLAAVIGDLDSLEDQAGWRDALGAERLLHLAEQDSTDLEKCLYSVAAPAYLGVGFLGGRADHALAAINALLKRSDRRLVLLSAEDAVFLAPRAWRITLPPRTRVSLVPLAPSRALRSAGLRWPLDGLSLAPGAQIGTSNETRAAPQDRAGAIDVEATFAGDGLWSSVVAIIPLEHLEAALSSLGVSAQSARPA